MTTRRAVEGNRGRWSGGAGHLAIGVGLLGAVLTASPAAWADPGPSIDHQPISSVPIGKPVEVHARIVSNSSGAVYNPTLYLRASGVSAFSRIELKAVPGVAGLYAATIPAELVTGPFEYYIEASDTEGNGPTRLGAIEAPLHVQVVSDVPLAPATPAPAPAPAAPPPAPTVTTRTVSASPNPAPLAVTQQPPATAGTTPVASYGLLGGGAVGATVGAILIGVGNSGLNTWIIDSNHLAGAKALSTTQIASEHSSADAEITAGACLVGAGVVAGAVGLYLFLDPPSADADKKAERDEASRHPTVVAQLLDF